MKLRKIITTAMIVNILAMTMAPGVYAAPKKGMPPGQMKKHVISNHGSNDEVVEYIINNRGSLPPGILKNIIRDANLSQDDLEELAEEGILNGLPGGISKNINAGGNYAGDEDNDQDDEESDDEKEIVGIITGLDIEERIIVIDNKEYKLPDEVEIEIDDEDAIFSDLKVGMKVELELDEDEAEINVIDKEDVTRIRGTIKELDLIGTYYIRIDEKEYALSDKAQVMIDGKEMQLKDLAAGMKAEVKIVDKEVIKVIVSTEVDKNLNGEIKELDLIGMYHIKLDTIEYKLSKESKVLIDKKESSLSDLKIGMEAEIEVSNDEVTMVRVSTTGFQKKSGEIKEIDLLGTYHIQLDKVEYLLSKEAKVIIDDELKELKDLKEGMNGEIKIIDNKVVKVTVSTPDYELETGEIKEIDLVGTHHLTIDSERYIVVEDVQVIIDEEEMELKDLETGMEAEIKILDNKIVKVIVSTPDYEIETGEIKDVDLIGTYHIKIDSHEYKLSKEAEIIIDGEESELKDLETGMDVKVKILDDIVVMIEEIE